MLLEDIVTFIKSRYPDNDFVPLHAPVFNGNEKKYVLDTLESTIVSSVGEFVNRFEQMICDYTGAKYAVAVVNGTSALHMSLLLAEVKPGDLVLTQALSFVATCNAIRYLGADPVFLDVDSDTLGLSPDAVKRYIETDTKRDPASGRLMDEKTGRRIAACVPMHTFGFPARVDELVELCKQYQIPLIEDAAESLGSLLKGKHTGTFGLMGIYSFNGNKTITSGGGGIIVTDNKELAKKAKHLTTQAKVPHEWEYIHDHIGYNYRCPNINAALACAQLEQIEQFIANKRETAKVYHNFFKESEIRHLVEPKESRSNYWLNSLIFPSKKERDKFLKFTNSHSVMTRPIWRLLHRLPMFSGCIHDQLINSKEIEQLLVNIPSSVTKNSA